MYKRHCQQQINSLQPFLFKEKQQITQKMDIFNRRTLLINLPAVSIVVNQSNVFLFSKSRIQLINLPGVYHSQNLKLKPNPEPEGNKLTSSIKFKVLVSPSKSFHGPFVSNNVLQSANWSQFNCVKETDNTASV